MKTDSQLQREVVDEFDWEPAVHAAAISVTVEDGVVRLSGEVCSYAEKWLAERAARRVTGIKALVLALDVALPALNQRSDAEISRCARNVLSWMSSLPSGAVTVTVESGWITLSGTVDWLYQKQAAADAVRTLMGVRGLGDQIALQAAASSLQVASDIEAALQRRARADTQQIAVAVNGADVTLTGTVQSSAQHELALHSAWARPGVHRVVDQLKLAP